jgi:hypothetical protein
MALMVMAPLVMAFMTSLFRRTYGVARSRTVRVWRKMRAD